MENQYLLIEELTSITKDLLDIYNRKIKDLDDSVFRQQPEAGKWSVSECLEHLNLYGDYYLPVFKALLNQNIAAKDDYRGGWPGKYLANSMKVADGNIKNKMRTFKDKNPVSTGVRADVKESFQRQQEEYLDILGKALHSDLNRLKVPITIAKWIKLKMGDALQFVVYHNQRHILQAENTIKLLKEKAPAE